MWSSLPNSVRDLIKFILILGFVGGFSYISVEAFYRLYKRTHYPKLDPMITDPSYADLRRFELFTGDWSEYLITGYHLEIDENLHQVTVFNDYLSVNVLYNGQKLIYAYALMFNENGPFKGVDLDITDEDIRQQLLEIITEYGKPSGTSGGNR